MSLCEHAGNKFNMFRVFEFRMGRPLGALGVEVGVRGAKPRKGREEG